MSSSSSLPSKVVSPAKALNTLKQRRQARRSVSGLKWVLSDTIDGLNPAHWDTLSVHSIFLSRDYLHVMEQHLPGNVLPRYAMGYHDGRPAVIMLVQRVTVSGDQLRKPGVRRRLLGKPLAQLEARLEEQVLVCGNLLVWGPRSLAFSAEVDEATLWHGVGEALYRLRRADKLQGESDFAMIKDFAGDSDTARAALRLLGYRSLETEPDMVLTLDPAWRSFEDYLASMTSSYRSSARKLLKDCSAAGVSFRLVDAQELQARQDEVHALYEQVHGAQGLRLVSLQPSYLAALAQTLGARWRCRVAERDGRWLGFITSVDDGETTLGYYVGYDRQTNADVPLYLTLLQSTVEDAIAFGARRLSLGRTALEPKAKIGCKPEPICCGVRHRVSALNWIVSALTRNAVHDEPPERNPFKVAKLAKPAP